VKYTTIFKNSHTFLTFSGQILESPETHHRPECRNHLLNEMTQIDQINIIINEKKLKNHIRVDKNTEQMKEDSAILSTIK
jgi:hypothetical protein